MQRQDFTVTGTGVSAPFALDTDVTNFQVGLGAKITSGSATYTVEHTFDDIFPDVNNGEAQFNPSTAKWYGTSGMTNQTGDSEGNLAFPVTAVRLNVTGGAGTVKLTILQAGGR